jgi:hypothetical protein
MMTEKYDWVKFFETHDFTDQKIGARDDTVVFYF